ncbi:MAG: hypothetical protein E6Q75_03925 [Rheinheimera sp.]|nr:MAG: hypothetical protein E6Q75_03925 [Rheinheimera sp.]
MTDQEARISIPTVEPELYSLITEYDLRICPFDLVDKTDDFTERLKKALLVGRLEIAEGYQTEPPALAMLSDDADIILRRGDFDYITRASSALWEIKQIIDRQQNERFTFNEIATILAEESGGNVDYIRNQQLKAFEDGRLVFFRDGSPVDPETFNHPMGAFAFDDEYSTPERINDWLRSWGAEYRFPSKSEVPQENPKQKGLMQEDAIINWLKLNAHDPLALPINPLGKAGVKSDCKKYHLANHSKLFMSKGAFDSAWKKLKSQKRIIDRKP